MSIRSLIAWLVIAGYAGTIICGIALAFWPQASRLLRFGPVAAVCAYFFAGAVYFFVRGVASYLEIPIACFGLFLAVRCLWRPSLLARVYSGCSFVFWPALLIRCLEYVTQTRLIS